MAANGKNGKGNGFATARRAGRRNLRARTRTAGSAGMPRWLAALVVLAGIGFIGLIALFAAALAVYSNYSDQLVAPDELAINQPSYGAKVLDRNGKLLYEYVDDRSGLRRPIKLENISDAFLAATISTEDDSFFTNPGVNIKGLARAAWENFSPLSSTPGVLGGGSGGSSITQQLVKNVYIAQEERQKRSVGRKLRETVFALELTQRYSKDQILEWYVNQISYGGVYNGVEAASLGYFGKPAKDLSLPEAALLAGIPQSPAAYDPVNHPEAARERRDEILDLLERNGRVQIGRDKYFEPSHDQIEAAKAEDVSIAVKRFPIEAPHFVLEYIQPQIERLYGRDALFRDGLVVQTTLDLDLQHQTSDIMERWIREFENISNSRNGAMMLMDPKTGEILVMIGSRDYFREDIQGKNNNATACNSPGSSFKPFAYLTAFLELGWGPGTVVLDTPVSFKEIDGTEFVPSNPSHNFSGPITIRNALGNSLNVPAVKTAAAVGAEKIVAEARKVGFMNTFRVTSEGGCSNGAGYGPAIATGGVGVTLEEMVFGYTVLANGGIMRGQTTMTPQSRRANERKIDPISILKVIDAQGRVRFDVENQRREERVVKEEYTYLVSSVLSDPQSQCVTFGCGGISIPGRQAATKTGTSEPFDPKGPNAGKIGETWAFGYTPDIVVGIWAGNADNAPIVNIFSTSISFRAMRDTLQAWYNGRPGTPFNRPEGLVEETVCVPSGKLPSPLCGRTTRDLFVKDTLPKQQDDWWRRVRIDGRTNLLAAANTPPQFVEERIMLVLPPELLKTDDDKKRAQEWADALGIPLAPTQVSQASGGGPGPASDLPAVIFSPTAGQAVSGVVQVTGRASSPDFLTFRLEFGGGLAPGNWTTIVESTTQVSSGSLGLWNTSGLQQGIYTVRLVVQDRTRGLITATVTVSVGPVATPTPPGTPVGRP